MASFDLYFPKLLRHEGGFVDHPLDAGGPTNKGITLRTLRHYRPNATIQDLKDISTEAVAKIYKQGYWDKMRLNEVRSQKLAELICDHGVNAGITRSVKMIQYLLAIRHKVSLVIDGIMGPITLAAINNADADTLYNQFFSLRQQYYNYRAGTPIDNDDISVFFNQVLKVSPNPSQRVFLKGWLSRLESFPKPTGVAILEIIAVIGVFLYFFRKN